MKKETQNLILGIVLGVVATSAFCYIIYLMNKNDALTEENDLLKTKANSSSGKERIIDLNSVPKIIRSDFRHLAEHEIIENKADTYSNALERLHFLKNHIENRDGYKILYKENKAVTKEKDLHILYDLAWFKTHCDVNKEVNNGRGPVDFKISIGLDQTLVEFKLASNTQLKKNLSNQLGIYAKANEQPSKIICIFFMTEKQEKRVNKVLTEIGLKNKKNIVLIDGRTDNKVSASKANHSKKVMA